MDTSDFEPPPVEESLAELHRSGWYVGDCAVINAHKGLVWIVFGSNGENLIRTERRTGAGQDLRGGTRES